MLSYCNVHVTKNTGKNSHFPEHQWVALPTVVFILGQQLLI